LELNNGDRPIDYVVIADLLEDFNQASLMFYRRTLKWKYMVMRRPLQRVKLMPEKNERRDVEVAEGGCTMFLKMV